MAGDKVESLSRRAKWDSPCGLLRSKITGTERSWRRQAFSAAPPSQQPAPGPARVEPGVQALGIPKHRGDFSGVPSLEICSGSVLICPVSLEDAGAQDKPVA
ncbi:Hypothetical predicted protein [Marmota monax]|uniref:Uncharacterized protein n=1 Tax=Marmota monax TaxID=9995 RepID=A0A5E4CF06_MARMO|nr:hypothetical protein GHT09_020558 [Marmota monax]VTJ80473.1 Hypothetical predicted protein [Marmota monax]